MVAYFFSSVDRDDQFLSSAFYKFFLYSFKVKL